MICLRCGTPCPDGAVRCPSCSFELDARPGSSGRSPVRPPGRPSGSTAAPPPPPGPRPPVGSRPPGTAARPAARPGPPAVPGAPAPAAPGPTRSSRRLPALLEPGQVVAERFEVRALLGEGPTGIVYRALDQDVEIEVALKVLGAERLPDPQSRVRFVQGLSRLVHVQHPNVVRCFELGLYQDRVFFALQLCEGLSLRKVITLRRDKGETFSLADVEPIVAQVARGLGAAHRRGLLAGALRPENILVLPEAVKVSDVGLWRELPPSQLEIVMTAAHAAHYLAPEVRSGALADARADSYSLAVVIEELLGGPGRVPAPLAPVLEEARAVDAVKRLGVEQLAAELEAVARTGRRLPTRPARATRPKLTAPGPALPDPIPDAPATEAAVPGDRDKTRQVHEEELLRLRAESSGDTREIGLEDLLPGDEGETVEDAQAGEELRLRPPAGAELAERMAAREHATLRERPRAPAAEDSTLRRATPAQSSSLEPTDPRAAVPSPAAPAEEAGSTAPEAGASGPGVTDVTAVTAPSPALALAASRIAAEEAEAASRAAAAEAPPAGADRDASFEELATEQVEPLAGGDPDARFDELATVPVAGTDLKAGFDDLATERVERIAPPEIATERSPVGVPPAAAQGPPSPASGRPGESPGPRGAAGRPGARSDAHARPRSVRVQPPSPPRPIGENGSARHGAPEPALVYDGIPTLQLPPTASDTVRVMAPGREFGASVVARARGPLSLAGLVTIVLVCVAVTAATLVSLWLRQSQQAEQERTQKLKQMEMLRQREENARQTGATKGGSDAPEAAPVTPVPLARDGSGCPLGAKRSRVAGHDFCIDAYEYPGSGILPRTNVTLTEAERACAARGERLCTRREWTASCGGPAGASYPYGSALDRSRCNGSGALMAAGSFARCRSAAGTYDMVGNAAEWVSDRVAMGGSSSTGPERARCNAAESLDAGSARADVGFRCCVDVR